MTDALALLAQRNRIHPVERVNSAPGTWALHRDGSFQIGTNMRKVRTVEGGYVDASVG